MTTLVLGLGNPILGDDGVGWKVAEEIQSRLGTFDTPVEVEFASLGGLSLMERMLGYSRVILIDCMETGQAAVGTVRVLLLAELEDPMAGHSASAHDASLITALQAAEAMGADVPKRVDVVTIEAKQSFDFSEELSPEIAAAVPVAAKEVIRLLDAPED
jgi:hydrogenase maturation protease